MESSVKFSEKIDKLLPKLAKVKANLNVLVKDANNPFFKSKYADLNQHLSEVEPKLNEQGLLLLQPCSYVLGKNVVTSIIFDLESGQFIESSISIVGESKMQDSGGGVTYGRRYTLNALLVMTAEDDDGNTISGKTASKGSDKKPSPEKYNNATKDTGFRKPKTKPKTTESSDGGW